jgi:hypothetical protein
MIAGQQAGLQKQVKELIAHQEQTKAISGSLRDRQNVVNATTRFEALRREVSSLTFLRPCALIMSRDPFADGRCMYGTE